ncbi:MAG: CoA transferase, partial [Acetobacteraceae bacterium]|nr:CoA transferase [Acetobacteraceae bacterium]
GELVAQATGGHLYLNGDEDRAPVMIGVATATVQAGVEAAAGALSAYFHLLQTGQGQRIDVSMQQCVVGTLLNQTMLAQMVDREYNRGGEVRRERANTYATRVIWPCRDGHIYYSPVGGGGGSAREKSFAALVAWMAESGVTDPILTERDWTGKSPITQEKYDEVAKVIYDFLVTKTKQELIDRALQDRMLLAPVNDIPEIMENPQLRARGYFERLVDTARGTDLEYPANWVRMSRTPRPALTPAPHVDADGRSLRAELKEPRPRAKPWSGPKRAVGGKVFDGLKVLDFTWAAAGPTATKHLADNGATVIKVESTRHPDSVRLGGPYKDEIPGLNRSGFFADFNTSKLSITVDGGHPRAKEIIHPLVQWADVVADSFRPGVMDKWDFDYDSLCKVNPRIIAVSSSLYGVGGPWAQHPGFGTQGQASAGLHWMTGWPDRPPAGPYGAYTDAVAPRFIMAALAAALINREITGEGQRIEISQLEATITILAPEILRFQMAGERATRTANANPYALVHGVFPCMGDDRWIAIEVWTEKAYGALLDLLAVKEPVPHALRDPKAQIRAELDDAIAAATSRWDAFELADACRARGIAAGPALKARDLLVDPILSARHHFWELDHPEMGPLKYNGPSHHYEATPSCLTRGAPCIGEDNKRVMSEILSLPQDQIKSLIDDRVIR